MNTLHRPASAAQNSMRPAVETRGRTGILFYLFLLVLATGVFFLGVPVSQAKMPDRQHRDLFLVAIGVLGLAGAFVWANHDGTTRADRVLKWSALFLPGYALFQLVPLPLLVVGILSPRRAELVRGLEPLFGVRSFASLSVVPAATLTHFLLFSAYAVILLAARELTRRAGRNMWLLAIPLVLPAAIQAVFSLLQFSGNVPARGTYVIRNHLAGLLEMAFPFAVLYAVARLRAARNGGRRAGAEWGLAAAGFAVAALVLVGAFATLSRGGLGALLVSSMLVSFLLIGSLAAGRNMPLLTRAGIAAIMVCLAITALFLLTPDAMVGRLSEHTSEGRTTLWREGIGIIGDFPLVGCGLGGFETAFLKYKAAEGLFTVDYAHNDYLQFLAELGITGFVVLAALVGVVVQRSFAITSDASEVRWLALACLGAVTAILVHSLVDFNMYVVANASLFAWICGIAAGLKPSPPRLMKREADEG